MRGRTSKLSGQPLTVISTGSYIIGIDGNDIYIGSEALKRASQYVRHEDSIICYECGKKISLDSIGLLRIINGKVELVLCRDCVLKRVYSIGELIDSMCC